MQITVMPDILPNLQANELACHSFVNAAIIYKTPGLETKGHLLLRAIAVVTESSFLHVFSKS